VAEDGLLQGGKLFLLFCLFKRQGSVLICFEWYVTMLCGFTMGLDMFQRVYMATQNGFWIVFLLYGLG
jgi:hypothetical protein